MCIIILMNKSLCKNFYYSVFFEQFRVKMRIEIDLID